MSSGGYRHSTEADLTQKPAYAPGIASAGRSSAAGASAPTHAFAGRLGRPDVAWLIPLLVAAAYIVVFLFQLPHNITELAWNGDYASAFVVPEALVKAGTDGNMVMGSSGQWVPLWFGLLTAGLPLHRELWGVMPTLLFVGSALVVGWAVAQVADRRKALLAVLLAVIASPPALIFLMAPLAHNTVYPSTALLGAYLVWLTRGSGRRRVVALVAPPALGVMIGACLASDLLLATTALIPLALTAVLAGLRRDRRSRLVALSSLTTVAVAIPVAKLTTSIMHSLGFLTIYTPEKVVPLSELPERARLLFKGLGALFNGYLSSGHPGTLHTPLGIASDAVMSTALLTLILIGARTTVRFMGSGLRNDATQKTSGELARSLHVIYWVSSAAIACGVFWIAAETGGGTNLHESYYGTVIFSVAAVIPLALSSGGGPIRWLAPTGTAIFFASSLVGLTGGYIGYPPWISRSEPIVRKIAEANHVTVGYGGYLDASPLTWHAHGRIKVRPLMTCPNPGGASICPFYLESVPSWYVPRQRHTFLLTDTEEPWVSSLPSGLGKPLATYSFGAMHMYVYPYDIASLLGAKPD
jgi:hypothetical protein